jgi:hypothetical protein
MLAGIRDFSRQLNIVSVAVNQHLPVVVGMLSGRRNEGRTDIGEVGAKFFRNIDHAPVRDRSSEHEGSGEEYGGR